MSIISDLITLIRTATLGKDVRNAIADSLENINGRQNVSESDVDAIKAAYDAATKANTNVELTNARHDNINDVDYETVGARLDGHSSTLGEKTSKSYVDNLAASLASGSPKGVYSTLPLLQAAYPTGTTGIYLVTGNVAEVASLAISAAPTSIGNVQVTLNGVSTNIAVTSGVAEVASLTVAAPCSSSGDVTVTLNGVGTNVALDSGTDTTTDLVATKIRNTAFSGWTTGGTGSTVTFTATAIGVKTDASYSVGTTGATGTMTTTTQGVDADTTTTVATKIRGTSFSGWTTGGSGTTITFTCNATGVKTDSVYSAGSTGATGTMTTTTQGVDNDGKWYYWNGSAWTPGGVYQATSIADNSVTADMLKKYNMEKYKSINKVGSTQTAQTWSNGVKKMATSDNPLGSYTDVFIKMKFRFRHDQSSNISISVYGIANNTGGTLNGTIENIITPTSIPAGTDFTECEAVFKVTEMIAGTKNILVKSTATVSFTYDLEVYSIDIIDISQNTTIDGNLLLACFEYYNSDTFLIPDIPIEFYQIKKTEVEEATKIKVGVVGDSMSERINTDLSNLLINHNCITRCFGVGGETAITITARCGAIPVVAQPFTLKADGTKTNISITASDGRAIALGILTWGYMNAKFNICNVRGVDCVVEYDSENTTYTIRRVTAGGVDIIFNKPTTIESTNSGYGIREQDVLVFWMGTNGGYVDWDELADQIQRIATYAGTEKIIVLNMWKEGMSDGASHNARFGRRFLDIKEYCSKYAWQDLGLTLSESDQARVEAGNVPYVLYSEGDTTHCGDIVQPLIANEIYWRGVELGYWE